MHVDTVPLLPKTFKITLWQGRKNYLLQYFECLCYQWRNISTYLYLSEDMNSPPNSDFRFWNFAILNQKIKKQKWQCSQDLDLNPTCVQTLELISGVCLWISFSLCWNLRNATLCSITDPLIQGSCGLIKASKWHSKYTGFILSSSSKPESAWIQLYDFAIEQPNITCHSSFPFTYMSHFSYSCKMRYPLNLVLENWEYLWFYWTFCIVILDCGLKLHKLSILYPCHASEMNRNTLNHCLKFPLHSIFCHIGLQDIRHLFSRFWFLSNALSLLQILQISNKFT